MTTIPNKTRSGRVILLVVVFLIGVLVRLFPLGMLGFTGKVPFGCGGLYVLFAEKILEADYALPSLIPHYTLDGVPYAYPPLAFYILALLFDFTSLTKFTLMNFLPPIFSCVSLFAFYGLVRQITSQYWLGIASTFIYALLPTAFIEHLPGEGLVESLGTITFILAMIVMFRLNAENDWKSAVVLGMFGALNVVTSPGTMYGVAVSVAALWLLGYAGKRCSLNRLLVAFGIGVVASAPYWLVIIRNHGPDIFARTFMKQHGMQDVAKKLLFLFDVTGEPYLTLWGVLALLGVFYCIRAKNWSLPGWCGAVYLIPREFQYMMAVPLSILAAHGLLDVVMPGFALARELGIPKHRRGLRNLLGSTALVTLIVFTYGQWSAALAGIHIFLEGQYVSSTELEMMTWVQQHTDIHSTFIVIGDEIEWFPEITERTTINVVEGSEWAETDEVYWLQNDLASCVDPECYLETANEYVLLPDYVYVSKSIETATLLQLCDYSDRLLTVQENDGAILFGVLR